MSISFSSAIGTGTTLILKSKFLHWYSVWGFVYFLYTSMIPIVLKLSPLFNTGIPFISYFMITWSCPPSTISISTAWKGSFLSWGTLICVSAIIMSHFYYYFNILHIFLECSPTSSYSSWCSYSSIKIPIQSSPPTPKNPIFNPWYYFTM